MGDSISRVDHNARRPAGRVKGKDGLNSDVERGRSEALEHDLRHSLTVCFRIQRRLSKQYWVLTR